MTRCSQCGAFMRVTTYTYTDSHGSSRTGVLYRCNNTRNFEHDDTVDRAP